MAQYVQTKRDLGCKASQVTLLEEGINTENRSAKEFWSLLGGKTEYRGTYAQTPARTCTWSTDVEMRITFHTQ